MIDVLPSSSAQPAARPASSNYAQNQSPDAQEQEPKPQPAARPVEKLSTEESQTVRMDPAIQELLKLFNGEINMITKDLPTRQADEDAPAAAAEIHIDTDDEEELS